MKIINYVFTFFLVLMAGTLLSFCKSSINDTVNSKEKPAVLVFSKTAGFRHDSIEKGIATIEELGKNNNFEVEHTEDSTLFTNNNLKRFKAIIFLSTTGDILNADQQKAFEQYIEHGGGFVGIHAAADTEYDWPWYNKLVGAWFLSHPKQQNATIDVIDKNHPSTKHLPNTWTRWDEWYNYKDINPETKVLMKLDETSYEGGKNGDNHPIAWYHNFDGGRAFYTGLGHTKESYDDEAFRLHLLGGIKYAMGE
ncbi:ThuA domain-containing protein [Olivibacter domesticus]|uniref:ThuA-like domain-containing protein n=1 Tax=Olivibacter domesticus TaxID=407022 RepID=A0A1H7U511_OLID1|nr:ThuA domain-containing protein [Olivibacter domesticus]SEL91347.1 hypothetical protein SAMN05661044_03714 [Olivibacter domesticus]